MVTGKQLGKNDSPFFCTGVEVTSMKRRFIQSLNPLEIGRLVLPVACRDESAGVRFSTVKQAETRYIKRTWKVKGTLSSGVSAS